MDPPTVSNEIIPHRRAQKPISLVTAEAAPRPLEAAWIARESRPQRAAGQQSPTRGNGSPSHRAGAREVVAVTTDNRELTYFLRVRAAGDRGARIARAPRCQRPPQ
ncbi:hypothetical protein LEMLEM_LOCUS20007 [Lemmus lemmus]